MCSQIYILPFLPSALVTHTPTAQAQGMTDRSVRSEQQANEHHLEAAVKTQWVCVLVRSPVVVVQSQGIVGTCGATANTDRVSRRRIHLISCGHNTDHACCRATDQAAAASSKRVNHAAAQKQCLSPLTREL